MNAILPLSDKEKLLNRLSSLITLRPHYELPTMCWFYLGRLNRNGYGRVAWNGREPVLHRVLYELHTGIILPRTIVLDHLCRVRCCCNPDHMDPVTVQVNTRRGLAVLFNPVSTKEFAL